MKERVLRPPHCALRRAPIGRAALALGIVLSSVAVAACASSDDEGSGRLTLPAEALVALDPTAIERTTGADADSDTTAGPTTAATTAPTAAPATAATTAPATQVETLPVPAPPPDPRADEPYVELGTIEIPRIGLSTPMLEGIALATLDRGPGHWPGTALPGGLGNVVVAGHRTSHGKVFRRIDELAPGDEVIFTVGAGRFVYLVTETTVVAPDAIYIIEQTNAHTATLFACHPPGSTKQRIVVHLELKDQV